MAGKRKIGIFGGTFDPVHFGHLRAAEEVCEVIGLSRVFFVPNRVPPHKEAGPSASARERLSMVRAAIRGAARFDVSDVELKRDGPSYTLDTLRHFHERFGSNVTLVFVLGTDAFAEIGTWYEAGDVLSAADFVVMTRPGTRLSRPLSALPQPLARTYSSDEGAGCWRHESGRTLSLLDVTHLDISASDVRARIAAGRSIRYLVPDPVAVYIRRRGLYKPVVSD